MAMSAEFFLYKLNFDLIFSIAQFIFTILNISSGGVKEGILKCVDTKS